MWPFSSYPEASAPEIDGKTYDYIVVGGGTAGCCVAGRLSEDPEVSVLVLDKGHVKDNFVSRVPLMSQNFWMGDPLQVQSTRYTEPIPNANGRKNRIWTAEGLGGASRINAMLLTRGVPGGYNQWAEEFGLGEWAWDQVEPYFRKSENAEAHPNSSWRGHEGPIPVRQSFPPFKWCHYIEKAAEKLGLPVETDCNNPAAPAMGLFRLDMAIDRGGTRVSAYRAFLDKDTATKRRGHLTVCTGVIASRLDVDKRAGLTHGVYVRPIAGHAGNDIHVRARREVIICSGAVCSPLILMHSGIGPKAQLEAHEIPVVKELPVGVTLQDHCSFAIMLELPKSETLSMLESIWGLWHILLWIFLGTGLMGRGSTPQSVFLRTTAINDETMTVDATPDNTDALKPTNVPDVEIMIQPVSSFERHVPGHSLISLFPTLVQPRSTGSIEIASKDPLANPRIKHPLLNDSRDLVPIRRAVRFTLRLAQEFQDSGYPYPAPITFAPGVNLNLLSEWERSAPAATDGSYTFASKAENTTNGREKASPAVNKTWRDVTDDEIDDYIKRIGMASLHVACTCPISQDESSGVVDQKLRVHGFRNLRIADASVFPKIPSAHTMAPTIMIAERCADFVKGAWQERPE